MERIVKTIKGKNGRLYVEADGNRYLAASCQPEIQLLEEVAQVPVLGNGQIIKRRVLTLLLTFNQAMKCPVDIENVTGFGLRGDFLGRDGKYRELTFSRCLLASDLDLTDAGSCTFEIVCSPEMMKQLRTM